MAVEHLVIAGKSGVGKSTTAANLSAALAEKGKRVLLIGYDSRWSSTGILCGGNELTPLPGWQGEDAPLQALGHAGALCLEAGAALESGAATGGEILTHPLIADYDPEYVVHDTAWEPAGSFTLPPGIDGVSRLLAVTSADKCALQAVNDIFAWLNTVASAECRFGGVVANNLSGPLYEAIVSDFASQTGAVISATVPRSITVSVSDFYSQTLLQSAPFSHVSYAYRKLARDLEKSGEKRRPKPLSSDALSNWAQKWGDIITELETGVVKDGLGI
ncbi:iron-sulfur cluster-binding ATPase, NifH/FrxC family [Citrifermentans bemidjiense Bem]|uniref:Iron-sulfur cluster-binding ATPase, NifH/FrxC family n=1 Tax=Citrifermentans bemidjiense (strain ATCC BAA-1014 / DSM 16622 / JCM 12645 / Bem) TaxID=404380 RepID=B5EA41_CITBB|nr:AAA family ATPase [Citrifermentans bemidjiense]ACH38747.1 iron-sulfur cluster-binding ATPase, NifH/FrxC family [Citrifermentans bemidjiense Bem]